MPGRFEIYRNTVVFVPTRELQERTLYSIKIKSGIKSKGSNDTLGEDTIISFETTEKYVQSRSSFGFDKIFWEFHPDNDFAFEVFHSNLPSNSVSLWAYKFDSLDEFLNEYSNSVDSEFAWTRYHSSTSVTPDKDKRIFASEVTLEEQGRTRLGPLGSGKRSCPFPSTYGCWCSDARRYARPYRKLQGSDTTNDCGLRGRLQCSGSGSYTSG